MKLDMIATYLSNYATESIRSMENNKTLVKELTDRKM